MSAPGFDTLALNLDGAIAEVRLARPERSNALNATMWQEIRQAFEWIDSAPEIRVAILSGEGRHFCAGIDLGMLAGVQQQIAAADGARSREALRRLILDLQDCLTAIERCRKPVIAAIHGACVGGALDLVTCCDLRYAAADAIFSIKEIDIGMAADVGTLQRLPRIIGDGMLRELAYTGRQFGAEEARSIGLVNRVYADQESLLAGVMDIAREVAAKSPIAVTGTKAMISYMRDHTVNDGLEYVATWNSAMLQSNDLRVAIAAHMSKQKPEFVD